MQGKRGRYQVNFRYLVAGYLSYVPEMEVALTEVGEVYGLFDGADVVGEHDFEVGGLQRCSYQAHSCEEFGDLQRANYTFGILMINKSSEGGVTHAYEHQVSELYDCRPGSAAGGPPSGQATENHSQGCC